MLSKERIVQVITTILLFGLGYFLINNHSHVMEDRVDDLSNEIVNSQSLSLEESVIRATSSATILKNHMHVVNGDMGDFEDYAKDLYELLGGITNIQLAPNGIVTKIYPIKGHEKAIGHDIFKSDNRKKEAFLAKNSRKLTLAGPFPLVQGGVAIIARSPIYLHLESDYKKNLKHSHVDSNKFWGFASSLVLLDDLLKKTDLHLLKDKNYLFRLWRFHPDSGDVDIFAGEKNFPNKKIFTKNINVPNGEWYLDIEYVGSSFSMYFMNTLYSLNFLVSLLLGYLLFVILIRPKELKIIVDAKTHELIVKNRELVHEKLELRKLSNAVTYNSNAIFIANKEGIIEYINPAYEQMTGYSFEDIINKETDLFQTEINYLIENKMTLTGQGVYENKNKEQFISKITISIIKDSDYNITSYVGVCEEITQKIKDDILIQEKQILLLQQSKMASMGEMLGNIAHQWRQPLSVISVASSGLKMQHEMKILTDKRLVELIDGISKATKYLSTTIDDFSNFFKPNKEKTISSTTNLIEKTLNIIDAQFKSSKVEIVKNIEEIEFLSYQNELVQVLINILNNARDQLIKEDIQRKLIFINISKNENKLIIKIKDNANGIDPSIINKIFEPYFSTKDKSIGTGIGLYMSREIIIKHMKGEFFVKNDDFEYEHKKYRGAEFHIILNIENSYSI